MKVPMAFRFQTLFGRTYPLAEELNDELPETTYTEHSGHGNDTAGPDEPFMAYVRSMMYQPESIPTATVVRRPPNVTIDPFKYSKQSLLTGFNKAADDPNERKGRIAHG
jgi:hypothetical protein